MLEFHVGKLSIEEFREYYRTLSDLQDFYIRRTNGQPGPFDLGDDERNHVERDLNHLITWTDNGEIVGHCIWHETTTEDMIPDDPRDDEDRRCLLDLFGGKKDNLVELHELWLRTEHRGKGFGRHFFDFFENYMSRAGFDGIVFYTDHEGAIKLCRERGYREGFLESSEWYVFTLPLSIH
jgi:ribosomal protein S18 acetylase RimI-like enzyme